MFSLVWKNIGNTYENSSDGIIAWPGTLPTFGTCTSPTFGTSPLPVLQTRLDVNSRTRWRLWSSTLKKRSTPLVDTMMSVDVPTDTKGSWVCKTGSTTSTVVKHLNRRSWYRNFIRCLISSKKCSSSIIYPLSPIQKNMY
jgi:hypothetical protein